MVRISIAVLVSFFVFMIIGGCADRQAGVQVSETRLLLDTYCSITIHGSGDSINEDLLDEAFELIAEMEALFSITVEGSDVWRINHAGGEPVVVDSRTIEVVVAGLEFGELSDGLFDITIGRLSRLWTFTEGVKGPGVLTPEGVEGPGVLTPEGVEGPGVLTLGDAMAGLG